MPALQRSAAGIIGEGARGHFVVGAGHLDGLAGFQIVQSEIDGAATIVARALSGIGDEDFAFRWGRLPEDLRYVPGAVRVVNQQAVAVRLKAMQRANEGFSRGALKEGAGLRIDGSAEEIVGSGVADIQVDCGVERS